MRRLFGDLAEFVQIALAVLAIVLVVGGIQLACAWTEHLMPPAPSADAGAT